MARQRWLLLPVLALAITLMSTGPIAAAENRGEVSASQLSELGLGSMEKVSDTKGMEIRGKGFRFRLTNGPSVITFNIGFVFYKNIYRFP